ncbi:hypothetical protein AURDEDRAFT_160895 [Auricularia subglabra TFB-10046 SS5]|nr:hypothetical protein AURDEDRAFT_160895 [Auricularia subglabra TFB-10046 SS5]
MARGLSPEETMLRSDLKDWIENGRPSETRVAGTGAEDARAFGGAENDLDDDDMSEVIDPSDSEDEGSR